MPVAWHFNTTLPVWQQIISHIRADVLNGTYQPGEQIPAVRQLAIEAGVNPNTMQRALTGLESEGLLISKGTVGRFVTTDTDVLGRAQTVLHEETIRRVVGEALALGITREELIAYLSAADGQPSDCTQRDRNESNTEGSDLS